MLASHSPAASGTMIAVASVAMTLLAVFAADRALMPWLSALRSEHARRCFDAAMQLLADDTRSLDGFAGQYLEGIYSPDRRCLVHKLLVDISYSVADNGSYSHDARYIHSLVDVYSGKLLASYGRLYECEAGRECEVSRDFGKEGDVLTDAYWVEHSLDQPVSTMLTLDEFLIRKQELVSDHIIWGR
jgi:hypothetical protein